MRSVALMIIAMWAASFGAILGFLPFGFLYGTRAGTAELYVISAIVALGTVFITRLMMVDIPMLDTPNRINKGIRTMPYIWCFSWGFLGATLARLFWFGAKNWF